MLRTRNYVLFLLACAFLTFGIVNELVKDGGRDGAASVATPFVPSESRLATASATVALPETLNRQAKRAALASAVEREVFPEAPVANLPPPAPPEEVLPDTKPKEVQYCLREKPVRRVPTWSLQGSYFAVIEGARLLFAAPQGTSTAPLALVQLALPQTAATNEYCLPQLIVGVSLTGEFLFNDEAARWHHKGEGELVGYALDGIPIYGVRQAATDTCGGAVTAGSYAYYLGTERTNILNCYRELPATI